MGEVKYDIVAEKEKEIDALVKELKEWRDWKSESEVSSKTALDLDHSGGLGYVVVSLFVVGGLGMIWEAMGGNRNHAFMGGAILAIVLFFSRKAFFRSTHQKNALQKEAELERRIEEKKIELAKVRVQISDS